MFFGKRRCDIKPLVLNDIPLETVDEWKYLGTTIVGGKGFSFLARPDISNFFRAANAVLNVLSGAQEHSTVPSPYKLCSDINLRL